MGQAEPTNRQGNLTYIKNQTYRQRHCCRTPSGLGRLLAIFETDFASKPGVGQRKHEAQLLCISGADPLTPANYRMQAKFRTLKAARDAQVSQTCRGMS